LLSSLITPDHSLLLRDNRFSAWLSSSVFLFPTAQQPSFPGTAVVPAISLERSCAKAKMNLCTFVHYWYELRAGQTKIRVPTKPTSRTILPTTN
jgi:hypothetical protein